MKKATLSIILAFAILLMGCQKTADTPEQPDITNAVTVVHTKIVERVIKETVVVDEAGNIIIGDETPMPTIDLPTIVPPPTPVPEIGQTGEFKEEDLQKLFQIWDLVEEGYDGDLPTDDRLVDALINASLEQLNDPYTIYFPPAIAKQVRDSFEGDYAGIGAYVDINKQGYFAISRPMKGSPAEQAGLLPQDVVLKIDGESTVGLLLDDIISKVRGPKNEPVVLNIVRSGVAEPFDVTVIRDDIIVPVVETESLKDGKVGYIYLSQFNDEATKQLTTAVKTFLQDGVESIILDVRYNGGGLLTEAVTVGDLFLDKGDYLFVRNKTGVIKETYTTQNGQIGEDVELVLLVNEYSASASEILAGSLKDRERATLIGQTTLGKGSVQTMQDLPDGSQFRVTIARFYSAKNNPIHGIGVEPDIFFDYVPLQLGDPETDLTVQRALEYLEKGE